MDAITYLALLRGINVGGKNKLPMKALAGFFAEAGCANVETVIQSGNVIFSAVGDTAELPGLITARIAAVFGFKAPVQLRTTAELARIVADNPFLAAGVAEDTLHVVFLAGPPSPSRIESLDPRRSPPDAFVVRGQVIYLQLPNGVADSRLTNAYFDSRLDTISTARNWRTVTRLLARMKGRSDAITL